MPRPIETLLSLPRVRLFDRVPILETERMIETLISRVEYRTKLLKNAIEVSQGSAEQFAADDSGLSALLEEVASAEYVVTRHSKRILEEMLSDIYQDGYIFKDFRKGITPLCELSTRLSEVSRIADRLADKTKEETIDVARALMIDPPRRSDHEQMS